jgi:hypothetical protein
MSGGGNNQATSTAATALQSGGGLVKGVSGFMAGKANARLARAEAAGAVRTGVAQDDEIRLAARRTAGEAIAAMGAAGGGLGSGSALDVLREIEVESGLDRLRVKADAKNRAGALNYQARIAKRQGALELLGGVMEAGAQAAGGGGG